MAKPVIDYITEKCHTCGSSDAPIQCGHVHHGKRTIMLSWCENHDRGRHAEMKFMLDPVKYCRSKSGCFGMYKAKKHGKILETEVV